MNFVDQRELKPRPGLCSLHEPELAMATSNNHSAALLAAIFDSARDYAIFSMSPDRTITSWNPGAKLLLGWDEDDILGASGDLLFTEEDRAAGAPENEALTALNDGRAEDERWHVRKDGSRFWGSGVMVPLRGVPGFLKIMRDRTAERQATQALAESEARFRTLAEHIPQLVWRSRSMGDRTWGSPQWIAFTGLSEAKSLGLGWLDAIHPDDKHATMDAWAEAERRGELYIEHRTRRSVDGEYRWFQTRASRLTDSAGHTIEWFGTSTDVHELKRLQERQQVLLRELHHRSRNLLAIVNSVARRTKALSSSLDDFAEKLEDRIGALARVQSLVGGEDRPELLLSDLVRAEVSAHGADWTTRVLIDGPPVLLRERAAEALGLAVHELATNAVKYGALASEAGRLEISWQIREDKWLDFSWRESGLKKEPDTNKRGYGRELIEVALPHALGAQTRLDIQADSVVCSIELPDYERVQTGS
jgi:PAS domain S-box-containing protein